MPPIERCIAAWLKSGARSPRKPIRLFRGFCGSRQGGVLAKKMRHCVWQCLRKNHFDFLRRHYPHQVKGRNSQLPLSLFTSSPEFHFIIITLEETVNQKNPAHSFTVTYMLLFTGKVLRGVFCEQSSQKTRELRCKIMRLHDFCASQSVLLVTEWTVTLYSLIAW